MKKSRIWFFVCLFICLIGSLSVYGVVSSPYQNYPYWYKVQTHCHSTQSDGAQSPYEVERAYRNAGFDVVCLTDHNKSTADPGVPHLLHILSSEHSNTAHHLVGLGIDLTKVDPTIDVDRNGVYDGSTNTLSNVQASINYFNAQGGLAFLAHPVDGTLGYSYTDVQSLYGYTGMEIYNAGYTTSQNNTNVSTYWDPTVREGKQAWAFAVDDCHNIYGRDFDRGFIMVNSAYAYANRNDLLQNIRNGNFMASVRARTWFSTQAGDGYDASEKCQDTWSLNIVKPNFTGSGILKRVFLFLKTSSLTDSGTDADFTLTIKGNAISLPNLPHNEFERYYGDSYRLSVQGYNINKNNLTNGDIRLSMNSNNAYLPEQIWVIGETIDNSYVLLAGTPAWPSTSWFSTDTSEGAPGYTIPAIHSVTSGTLKKTYLMHQTAWGAYVSTDDDFRYIIKGNVLTLPDYPYNEREDGITDIYTHDVQSFNIDLATLSYGDIRYRTLGSNAWLPQSMWVIGETTTGGFAVLAGTPHWGSTPPAITVTYDQVANQLKVKLVSLEGSSSSIRFIGKNGLLTTVSLTKGQEYGYLISGQEGYIRVEAADVYGSVSYAQPVRIN